jgi:hypothetical protein
MPVRTSFGFWSALLVALALVSGPVVADTLGHACTYQGRLAFGGEALDGDCDLRFTLYDSETGGSSLGSVEHSTVPVVNGLFTVPLDFGTLPYLGEKRWLEIEARYPAGVGSYTMLTPRQEVTAAPYALYAVTAGNALGTTNRIAKFTQQRKLGNSVMYESAGRIGLGTTTPTADLEVESTDNPSVRVNNPSLAGRYAELMYHGSYGPLVRGGDGYHRMTVDANAGAGEAGVIVLGVNGDKVGIGQINPTARLEVESSEQIAGKFMTDYADVFTHAVHGEYTGSGLEDAIGVYGRSWPSNGYGFGGWFEGGDFGLFATGGDGAAKLDGHTRIEGDLVVTLPGGTPTGNVFPIAVYGEYLGTEIDDSIGVEGRSWQVPGYGYGGWFEGGRYGIFATGGTGAAYFSGPVVVDGVLTKAGGNFEIDHPLDPLNKTLSHSFVESPDMMNVYNGNVLLDENGGAEIILPEYFETLNRDFRYQLTPLGAAMPELHVAREVEGNVFAIAGGVAGKRVSWQVTGVRRDPWAEQNRIEVEQYKPDWMRGAYLHPEAYGQPASSSARLRERGQR